MNRKERSVLKRKQNIKLRRRRGSYIGVALQIRNKQNNSIPLCAEERRWLLDNRKVMACLSVQPINKRDPSNMERLGFKRQKVFSWYLIPPVILEQRNRYKVRHPLVRIFASLIALLFLLGQCLLKK